METLHEAKGFRSEKTKYGLDAPGAVLLSLALGLVGWGVGLALAFRGGAVAITGFVLVIVAVLPLSQAILMFHYAARGKYRLRDRMLARRQWSGFDQVLDVGTGRGLLLIGAAKRAISGRAVGIDIWSAADLLNNRPAKTQKNAEIERVSDRIELHNMDAQQMKFADARFDVVVSNLCLHNISTADGRNRACREIARVVKPGGDVLVADYKYWDSYLDAFAAAGLVPIDRMPERINFFPPLRLVHMRKPAQAER